MENQATATPPVEGAAPTEPVAAPIANNEPPVASTPPPAPAATEYVSQYKALITEENINEGDLPAEIKKLITGQHGYTTVYGRWKKTPTAGNMAALKKKDIEIADEIQDWIEKDLPEASAVPEPEPEPTPAPPPAEPTLEEKIQAKTKGGQIHENDVKAIMGKSYDAWRDHDKCKAGSLTLTRGFLSNYYKVS